MNETTSENSSRQFSKLRHEPYKRHYLFIKSWMPIYSCCKIQAQVLHGLLTTTTICTG